MFDARPTSQPPGARWAHVRLSAFASPAASAAHAPHLEPTPRVRTPCTRRLWRDCAEGAFTESLRSLTSHRHRRARATRLRVASPASAPFAPLSRARLARLNPPIRIAASCAPLEEHARTSRDAFVVFENPCARDSNGTQAIRARTSPLSTATTLAHADRDAGRSLGRPRSPRLHTGSLALPPMAASVAAISGSCELGVC